MLSGPVYSTFRRLVPPPATSSVAGSILRQRARCQPLLPYRSLRWSSSTFPHLTKCGQGLSAPSDFRDSTAVFVPRSVTTKCSSGGNELETVSSLARDHAAEVLPQVKQGGAGATFARNCDKSAPTSSGDVISPETGIGNDVEHLVDAEGVPANISTLVHGVDIDLEDFKDSFICPPSESAYHITLVQDLFTYMHETCHLPWWAVIVTATFALRTLLVPLNISLIRNSARLNNIRRQLEAKSEVYQKMKESSNTEGQERLAQEINDLFVTNKCNPSKNIMAPLFMTPIFLSVFMAWERIVVFTPSCMSGGFAWFENLQATDPTFMLPVLSALTWILTFKWGADKVRTTRAAEFESLCSYLSLAMIPVTQVLPQGIFLYWLSSNAFSLFLIFITRQPRIRKFLNIPERVTTAS